MAIVTRRIGLSLGADICWAKCFEDILAKLDLSIRSGRDTLRFEVERVPLQPFHLRREPRYDVVVDRLTHWYALQREWIKKAILLDGTYVFNNPWSVQSMEKHTTYAALMRLGIPVPATAMIPPKDYEEKPDLRVTLERYARLFDLGEVGTEIGYPAFTKPYDGGGWQGVSKVDDERELRAAYDQSGKLLLHLQAGVLPYDQFVRCVGFGPQTKVIQYDPSAPLHKRYTTTENFLSAQDQRLIEDITLTINAFFGWDFNSCEALLKNHVWHPIDFANPCPDSQVTSLHRHFPWLVKAYLRWAIFCAATKRPMRLNLDWEPYFKIADTKMPYRKKVAAYAKLARKHFDSVAFDKFCKQNLSKLDEVALEYFGSPDARDAVRKKVAALFPAHEVDEFTEHFCAEIQVWRASQVRARPARGKGARAEKASTETNPAPAARAKSRAAPRASAPKRRALARAR